MTYLKELGLDNLHDQNNSPAALPLLKLMGSSARRCVWLWI
jgi:hypothetical protein